MKILLLEDEPKVSAFIAKGLTEQNYVVNSVGEISAAKKIFQQGLFDLLILDIMLPDGSGIDFCKYIRNTNISIPILMLTAQDSLNDKVMGLQAGADDYLVKPFHFAELVARIEALLRRTNKASSTPHILTFEDLILNTWDKTAERNGIKIILTAKEYALLELFILNPNKTLSRDYIAQQVWGIGFDTHTNFIDVYINYLRNKIEKGFNGKLIHTIIGMGYILRSTTNQ